MKFKLFGIIWDISPIIALLHAFVGILLMAFIFPLAWGAVSAWLSIPYVIAIIIYVATAENFFDKVLLD